MERNAASLTLAVALTLISEKARFWSDGQLDLLGVAVPPRCMQPEKAKLLRQSLVEIDGHCKTALRVYQEAKECS